jgi:hypothetical protein
MADLPSSGIPLGQGLTESQWVAWFAGVTKDNPKMPRYTAAGAKTTTGQSITGDTWDEVYAALYAAGLKTSPPQTPDVIAQDTIVLMQTEAVATGLGTTVTYTGTFAVGAVQAAVAGASEAANSIPGLSGLAAIGDFFSRLTEGSTWIRVLEMVLGAGLVLVGLAHAASGTPAGRAAKSVAVKAALL